MGKFHLPFRLPSAGSIPFCHPIHWRPGDLLKYRWQNITQAWDAALSSPAFQSPPVAREGVYLQSPGDFNAKPVQSVPGTDDIVACAADSSTLYHTDHNCFQLDTTATKDYRECHKAGSRLWAAVKNWHGIWAFNAPECWTTPDPTQAASQIKYRTIQQDWSTAMTLDITSGVDTGEADALGISGSHLCSVGQNSGIITKTPTLTNVSGGAIDLNGVWAVSPTWTQGNGQENTPLVNLARLKNIIDNLLVGVSAAPSALAIVNNWMGTTLAAGGSYDDGFGTVTTMDAGATAQSAAITQVHSVVSGMTVLRKQTTNLTVSFAPAVGGTDWTLLTFDFASVYETITPGSGLFDVSADGKWTMTTHSVVTLKDPYTSADVYNQIKEMLKQSDLSDETINLIKNNTGGKYSSMRKDTQVGLAPLTACDEVGPTAPTFPDWNTCSGGTGSGGLGDGYWLPGDYYMDDCTRPKELSGGAYWHQVLWQDPHNYIWYDGVTTHAYFASSSDAPAGIQSGGGATLVTGLRTGEIYSHLKPGSDRLFDFGFVNSAHIPTLYGALTLDTLPETIYRWILTDSFPFTMCGTDSHFPQAWIAQQAGVCAAAKYVEFKEIWPSVNFGKPYGLDKFGVEQDTVCYVISPGVFRKTQNAIGPLATGGLQAGDFIMVSGDGIYIIATLGNTSGQGSAYDQTFNQFTYTLGAKVADIPAGADMSDWFASIGLTWPGGTFIGRLRRPTCPPFGLTQIGGGTYDGTSVTTLTLPATPFWNSWSTVASGVITLMVDLYSADANGNPATNLTPASVMLTKSTAGDLIATITSAGNDYSAAKFVIPHYHYAGGALNVQFLPEWDDSGSKGDFVTMNWTFNFRSAALPTPPTFYGYPHLTGWAGNQVNGCTSYSVADASIKFGPCCPSVVGIVPYYSQSPSGGSIPGGGSTPDSAQPVESFKISNLAGFPDTFPFDDTYGALWLGAVETTITNPFWEAPFFPNVSADVNLKQDDLGDNPVNDGTVNYFAHAPLVEARVTLPTYASGSPPPLPANCNLQFDTTGATATGGTNPQYVPPVYLADPTTPVWRPYAFMLSVCNSGSGGAGNEFWVAYKNFVNC